MKTNREEILLKAKAIRELELIEQFESYLGASVMAVKYYNENNPSEHLMVRCTMMTHEMVRQYPIENMANNIFRGKMQEAIDVYREYLEGLVDK
jgi:hypothetical protein